MFLVRTKLRKKNSRKTVESNKKAIHTHVGEEQEPT